MALGIAQIVHLYRTAGAARYGREAVDQEQHALQCAWLAQRSGASDELVAAALLHDLGHLLQPDATGPGNDLHEYRVLPFLRGAFPDAVVEPIRLHVAAKRFLCVIEACYGETLSPASQRSLQLQGGPFSAEEAAAFISQPFAEDAVDLRRWGDLAKDPGCTTPGWPHFEAVLRRACRVPMLTAP